MTPRQFGLAILLCTAGVVAAGAARPGNRQTAMELQLEPVVVAEVGRVAVANQTETVKPTIRVILASPYEAR